MASHFTDGTWYDGTGSPYVDQERAADPEFRARVDELQEALAGDVAAGTDPADVPSDSVGGGPATVEF